MAIMIMVFILLNCFLIKIIIIMTITISATYFCLNVNNEIKNYARVISGCYLFVIYTYVGI